VKLDLPLIGTTFRCSHCRKWGIIVHNNCPILVTFVSCTGKQWVLRTYLESETKSIKPCAWPDDVLVGWTAAKLRGEIEVVA
jgi:hypothetical protein